ncbi:hypothetical protein F5J12DRAFT_84908 [Pisolithus orientalis]|uniref:uncharacterized protein n=1 Tax=Pisolithus orientalis TaxID=936130 RepID=UPI00222494DE|nr:uncharacterized protein F5J12DRAFT_84908 [Pisolithus orientalis]KAI6007657.1 hypothetical protein F5J12DRAFT_84908 [Pisolithus orientalis]
MVLALDVKGERNITGGFRTTFDSGVPTLWGMHRVNLDRCPSFKLSQSQNAFDWFGAHTLHMFSEREHTSRVQRALLGRIPDTITSLKETLRTLFCLATGLGGETHAEFALCNPFEGRPVRNHPRDWYPARPCGPHSCS